MNIFQMKKGKFYHFITHIIQKFGKYKDIKRIREYVDQNYTIKDNEICMNCKLSSVLEFIHD